MKVRRILVNFIGSVTKIIKSHYGQKFNIGEYLDETKKENNAASSQPFNIFNSGEKKYNTELAQYLDETSRYATDIEDDVGAFPRDQLNISRSVVSDIATRNVFSK